MSRITEPHLPETPEHVLGELVQDEIVIEGRIFRIERPKESDHLLDDPVIKAAFAADEYMPYWADLWPVSRMLAEAVLKSEWPAGTETLEVGCGLGLPGVAALAKGLRVVFSDCDLTALRFAAVNARLNGFMDFELLPMDWRFPPEGRPFPFILASDLCFERRHVDPLVALIAKMLAKDGECWLTDQDRPPAPYLRETLVASGLRYHAEPKRAAIPGRHRNRGTLYRITRKSN